MRTKYTRRYSSLTGAGSLLDLSGDPRRFRQLAPPPRPGGDAEALAGDFRAIGGDLERALLAYAKQLPPHRQRELARRLAAEVKRNGPGNGTYEARERGRWQAAPAGEGSGG